MVEIEFQDQEDEEKYRKGGSYVRCIAFFNVFDIIILGMITGYSSLLYFAITSIVGSVRLYKGDTFGYGFGYVSGIFVMLFSFAWTLRIFLVPGWFSLKIGYLVALACIIIYRILSLIMLGKKCTKFYLEETKLAKDSEKYEDI